MSEDTKQVSKEQAREQELTGQLSGILTELNLVTPIALAKEAKVPPQMVYQYIRDSRLPVVYVGEHRYLTRRVADEWLNSRKAKAAEKQAKAVNA